MTVQAVDLGNAGRAWVRSTLTSGRVLAQSVVNAVDLNEGSTLVLGINEAELDVGSRFENARSRQGASSLRASAASLLKLARIITNGRDPSHIIVEDDLALPDDPHIANASTGSLLVAEGTVFHLTDLAELQEPQELASFLVTSASGYPLNAFILQSMSRSTIASSLAHTAAKAFATNIVGIINTIFDNEAFTVWVPASTLQRHEVQQALSRQVEGAVRP